MRYDTQRALQFMAFIDGVDAQVLEMGYLGKGQKGQQK